MAQRNTCTSNGDRFYHMHERVYQFSWYLGLAIWCAYGWISSVASTMFTFFSLIFENINTAPSVELCKINDSFEALRCMCWCVDESQFHKHTHVFAVLHAHHHTVCGGVEKLISKQRSHKQHLRWWRRSYLSSDHMIDFESNDSLLNSLFVIPSAVERKVWKINRKQ